MGISTSTRDGIIGTHDMDEEYDRQNYYLKLHCIWNYFSKVSLTDMSADIYNKPTRKTRQFVSSLQTTGSRRHSIIVSLS
jgi:hypothetical protein